MEKCRRMKSQQCMSRSWIYSWLERVVMMLPLDFAVSISLIHCMARRGEVRLLSSTLLFWSSLSSSVESRNLPRCVSGMWYPGLFSTPLCEEVPNPLAWFPVLIEMVISTLVTLTSCCPLKPRFWYHGHRFLAQIFLQNFPVRSFLVTASSHDGKTKKTNKKTTRIQISFNSKDSKKFFFTKSEENTKSKDTHNAAAREENTRKSEREEAEAVQGETIDITKADVEGSKGSSSSNDSPPIQEEMRQDTSTLTVLQKNTRSMNSSERLEELFREIHRVRWDVILISETPAPRQRYMRNPTRPHRNRIRKIHRQTWSCDSAEQKMEESD